MYEEYVKTCACMSLRSIGDAVSRAIQFITTPHTLAVNTVCFMIPCWHFPLLVAFDVLRTISIGGGGGGRFWFSMTMLDISTE